MNVFGIRQKTCKLLVKQLKTNDSHKGEVSVEIS